MESHPKRLELTYQDFIHPFYFPFLQYSVSYFIFINFKVIAVNRLLDKINEIIKFSILSQISKNELKRFGNSASLLFSFSFYGKQVAE
jgi:hypothetical protein